jgi:CBS domain-containing protein
MSKKIIKASPGESIVAVSKKMLKSDTGCVIVYKDTKAVGIITERDVVRRVVAKGYDINKITVGDIMSTPVISIEPDVNIFYAGKLMKDKDFKRLPVAEHGKIIGVLTDGGLTGYFTVKKKDMIISSLKNIVNSSKGIIKTLKEKRLKEN